MDQNNNIKYTPPVPPFLRYCSAIIPTAFDDSLSYYEALCALYKWLQDNITGVINNNAAVTQYYIDLVKELKSYVEHYFDNLDVQEEINNKLDAMVEDGTLASVLNNVILVDPTFRYLQRISLSTTQEYEGNSHTQLQGFCIAEGKIIACFINHQNADNYTRIAEINPYNGSIIRQAYLELNHANAITYSKKDSKLYVASCAKMVDDVYTNDNAIFTVDYNTFELLDTIAVSNIPDGHRIRSVWYDNDTNTLYGGDEHDMFIIDEATETITETIELETKYIDTSATNQTLKKVGSYYIGVYISYIAYWDMNCKLIKIEQIDTVQDGEYIGELEDLAFDSDGNIIIGCANNDSPRITTRNASFYISNNTKSASKPVRIFGSTTTASDIYVDASNATGIEKGTADYPFTTIQRAVNYVMLRNNFNNVIVIKSGTYDYVYIRGVRNVYFNITGQVTIDGLEILNSDLVIYKTGDDSTLEVNGISVKFSRLKNEFGFTVNKFTKAGVTGEDYNLYVYYGEANLYSCSFTGNDDHTLVKTNYGSIVVLRECTFADYDGYYAINAGNASVVYTYDLTLDKTVSDSEHNFRVAEGSRFYTRNLLNDANNWVFETQGMKYPSESEITPTHGFFGEVCTVDHHFNYIQFRVKLAGANSDHKDVLVKVDDLDSYVIETTALVSTGITYGKLELRYDSDTHVLSIYKSHTDWYAFSDGSNTYATNSTDSPTQPTKFAKIEKVRFLSI